MQKKIIKLVKTHWLFLVIVVVGIFLRTYKPLQWYMYGHDQDLSAWFVRDILENKHLRLIGQETSSKGIFIGPLFYYLQIPFYLIFHMDPAGVVLLPILISIFSIWSVYFVFSKIFNKQVGLVATLVHSLSYLVVFIEREVAPTQPVMLWTVWYLYALWFLYKGKQKTYLLIGILWGLVWHLNLALAILAPLVLMAQVFSKTKINFRYLILGLGIFAVLLSPFVAFEYRHNYQQTKAIIASLTTQKDHVDGLKDTRAEKLDRTMQLVNKNVDGLLWNHYLPIAPVYSLYLLLVLFVVLTIKRIIPWQLASMFVVWLVFYITFFTFNSINLSEYYLNGMNVVWISLFALAIGQLLKHKKLKIVGFAILAIFAYANLSTFLQKDTNESGYLQRKAIADYIAKDSREHGYPCVSVSYITTPGNNLGYRMFFYLNNLHVNLPKSESPVYTIVFPHSMVDHIDKSFGALGLVLPDYGRYNEEQIKVSCSGENTNLTEPMFGFTN